jgi:hypothetical protein
MNRMLVAIAAAMALGLAACATTPVVYTDFDPATQFGQYRTYSWQEEKAEHAAPLMQQRIIHAIDAQLSAKGWSRAPSGSSDVVVAASVDSRQEYEVDSYYDPWGWGGWGWGYGGWGHGYGWGMGYGYDNSRIRAYTVGTLMVDMFDARTKRAIWRGTAEQTVRRDPARQTADIYTAVQQMFATFPPGSMPAPAPTQQ